MLLPVLAIIIFLITFALATSLFFLFVETPLARRKMMTRLTALQEVSRSQRRCSRRAAQGIAERLAHSQQDSGDGAGNQQSAPFSRAGCHQAAGGNVCIDLHCAGTGGPGYRTFPGLSTLPRSGSCSTRRCSPLHCSEHRSGNEGLTSSKSSFQKLWTFWDERFAPGMLLQPGLS